MSYCSSRSVARVKLGCVLGFTLCLAAANTARAQGESPWGTAPRWDFAPAGYIPPQLNPAGVDLETRTLAEGVYALISARPPVNNHGFIVGDRGVLVIDSGINGARAAEVQAAVRAVTDKPILYLVNTNYHGDHTFGNYAFPAATTIVAHRKTAERMRVFDHERTFMLGTVRGNVGVFADVQLRMPDMVFDEYLRIDLGGRTVELHYFGPGTTSGGVVVYEPESRTAWTGNLVTGGSVPILLDYGARTFLGTITRLHETLDLKTIVPGHLPITDGNTVAVYMRYCGEIIHTTRAGLREGRTLKQVVQGGALGQAYLPPPNAPRRELRLRVLTGLHRMNVAQTYRELKTGGAREPPVQP